MKPVTIAVALLSLTGSGCWAGALEELAAKIEPELVGGGWEMTVDFQSVTLIRRDVQVLYDLQIGLGVSEEEKWAKHSFRENYRITILLDSKMSQAEYDTLRRVRDELVAQRTKGLNFQTFAYAKAENSAQRLVRLPDYYGERHSVYVYFSDDGIRRLRPKIVEAQRAKVKEILDKTYSKYTEAKFEPGGAANGSQPFRSATNQTSPAAGFRR